MQIEFENKFSQIGERGGGNDWHEFARSSRNLAGHLLAAEMDDMKPFARSLRRRGFVAQDVRSFLCVFLPFKLQPSCFASARSILGRY